ncbi:MAG: polyprenyl synthetase family protein [Phycisphaerae bacterium]|nr:polyprenyl synthetase family protein [Phycisphaerae bacterium]
MSTGTSPNIAGTIADRLAQWAKQFDARLERLLVPVPGVPATLAEAVLYAVSSGGKRVRPYIVTRICELCGGSSDDALAPAAALECIHAFSLVHDDLPAMDNDEFRRGRPTCHKAFGEAEAILAGDALVTLAFEMLATRMSDPRKAVAAVAELAAGAGWTGMIGGQISDIQSEQLPPDLALVKEIHRGKTARLFETAGRLGAIAAGVSTGASASSSLMTAAATFGQHLGLAFQVADDLLDVTGDAAEMGKAVAKDANAGKQTYPAAVGIAESQRIARELADAALAALEPFGRSADDLRELVRFVIERRN